MNSRRRRLDEIKRDIMILRNLQEATPERSVFKAFENLIFLLKRERNAIKEGQPVEKA